MTPRTPKPKPVEAWAVYTVGGALYMVLPDRDLAETYCVGRWTVRRVRVVQVPNKPKKRKPRNTSTWKVGISKETVFVNYPPKSKTRTKRKEKR